MMTERRGGFFARLLCSLMLLNFVHISVQQSNLLQSTWVSGPNTMNQFGAYGTKTVANAGNRPGGRSDSCGAWDPTNRQYWVFGGYGYNDASSGHLHDLWRFNMADKLWTWMSGTKLLNQLSVGTKGVAGASNGPGGRYSCSCWFDSINNSVWIFGGYGYAFTGTAGSLNDLWQYRINDGTWTWVNGSNTVNQLASYGSKDVPAPSNTPGSRYSGIPWFDAVNGELRLMYGYGRNAASQGYLSDHWRFRLNESTWTWVGGSSSLGASGAYGTKGTPGVSNAPGARRDASSWYDAVLREVWVFGGYGIDSVAATGNLNDFWKFSLNDSTWTWTTGSDLADQAGSYGIKGIASVSNTPGSRYSAVSWFDPANRDFWLFGGNGVGSFQDVWRFRQTSWTWMAGSSSTGQLGSYGTSGVAGISNIPGSRYGLLGWYDNSLGEMWMFGGFGLDAVTATPSGYLSDLWKLANIPSPQAPPQAAPQAPPQAAPKAAPQEAPTTAPQAPPQAAPQGSPQAAPEFAPEAAPQSAPAQAPIAQSGCFGPTPVGNVTCVDGRWVVYTNSSSLLTSDGATQQLSVTFAPNTTLVVSDPFIADNVTILVPLTTNPNAAGRLQVSNCVTLTGQVRIQSQNSGSADGFQDGQKLLLISSDHPECFDATVTTVIEGVQRDSSPSSAAASCSPTVTATPSVEVTVNAASLFALIDVTDCISSNPPISSGIIAGVVVGAIILSIVLIGAIWFLRKRHERATEERVQQQIIHSKLEHAGETAQPT